MQAFHGGILDEPVDLCYSSIMPREESVFERMLQPGNGDLPPEVAAYLPQWDFSPEDHALYEELSVKAQDGSLSGEERARLEEMLTANDLIMILRSKARASLKRQSPAA